MRAVRIAALAVTAVLLSVLVARVLTIDPPRPDSDAIVDPQPDGPNNVPAPPPAPGAKAAQPVKRRPSVQRVADARPQPAQPVQVEQAAPHPILLDADSPEAASQDSVAPVVTETASVDQPKGPVIVVPHERPKEPSRATRWLKAVGHALGIGRKDPAENAFR